MYHDNEDGRDLTVVLEVKGFETEQDRQKEAAAKRWVQAVNHHGEFGAWAFIICNDPRKLKETLKESLSKGSQRYKGRSRIV